MRRQAVLIVVIAALVIAIAWLRPSGTVVNTGATPRQVETGATGRVSVPPVEIDEFVEESAPSLPKPAMGEKAKPTSTTSPRVVSPPPKIRVSVVDAEAKPVAGAVILVVSVPHFGEVKFEERRTEEDGTIEVVRTNAAEYHFYSYKIGVGAGAAGPVTYQLDALLKYEACASLQVRCVSTNDVPLYEAGVELTTELHFGTWMDRSGNEKPRVAKLTPRKLMTDAHGLCTFSAVFAAGPARMRNRETRTPGIRHLVSAEWNTLKCTEAIERQPVESVPLFLQ